VITQTSANREICVIQFQPIPGSDPRDGSQAYAERSTRMGRSSLLVKTRTPFP
jgi:hypothetical protein